MEIDIRDFLSCLLFKLLRSLWDEASFNTPYH